MYWLKRLEAVMSNLSLARIMFGGSEEVRRIAGSGLTANVRSLAPLALVPAVAAQAKPSHSPLPGLFRRVWLRLSAKS
jgi:tetrahydromethanopterin S-methyltransferase subunit C